MPLPQMLARGLRRGGPGAQSELGCILFLTNLRVLSVPSTGLSQAEPPIYGHMGSGDLEFLVKGKVWNIVGHCHEGRRAA